MTRERAKSLKMGLHGQSLLGHLVGVVFVSDTSPKSIHIEGLGKAVQDLGISNITKTGIELPEKHMHEPVIRTPSENKTVVLNGIQNSTANYLKFAYMFFTFYT